MLKDLGTNSLWPHALADRKTPTLGMILWALSNVTDLFFRSLETCLICLPAEFVEKLHAVAMKVLLASPSGLVRRGYLCLTMWVARLTVSHLLQYSDRTVRRQTDTIHFQAVLTHLGRHYNAFSVGEVPRQYLPADQPYIEVCLLFSFSTSCSRSKSCSGNR